MKRQKLHNCSRHLFIWLILTCHGSTQNKSLSILLHSYWLKLLKQSKILTLSWVKVYRIIPESRILRLTFQRKVGLKMLNLADYNSFSDLFPVYLKTIDHLNLKLLMFYMHTESFKIWISKVQDFSNFELSLMHSECNGGQTESMEACSDPESFVRGGPTLKFLFLSWWGERGSK